MAEVISRPPLLTPQVTLPVLSSSVDWLTGTVTAPARLPFAQDAVARWQKVRSADGFPIRPYAANGYVGEYVDGITWGERADGAMIRLSGEMAQKHFASALTWVNNVSRVDFQVTLQDTVKARDWTECVLNDVKHDPRIMSGMTQFQMITSSRGGATFYIGRRTSSRFYRVYNKTAESQGVWPDVSWRFEVEYKPNRSQSWADKMRRMSWQPDDTRDAVVRAFSDYGFPVPCTSLPRGWTDKSPSEPTTDERKLDYLRKCIRPMVGRLRESISDEMLLDVLGFGIEPELAVSERQT